MSWDTASDELRNLISDGPLDKYNYRKMVFGELNGLNINFKTLEVRRINDFTSDEDPDNIGVYVNGELAAVNQDFPVTGEFVLDEPPVNGDTIVASYYSQWFLESEIVIFLRVATQWCLSISSIDGVSPGLRPSVLHYAAAEAYQKLSLRFARMRSDEYRVEDAMSKERMEMASMYQKASVDERAIAETLRSQFYTKNDQYKQPMSVSILGTVPSVQPKR